MVRPSVIARPFSINLRLAFASEKAAFRRRITPVSTAIPGPVQRGDLQFNPFLPITNKVILIGGSSHAGKSTLARSLAEKLGGECRSTDSLARHPGRPWNHATGIVKEHVAQHYATLSGEELIADVLAHYRRNVLPQIAEMLVKHTSGSVAGNLVLEGSALWPDDIAQLDLRGCAAIWLTAEDELFKERIFAESRYEFATAEGRHLIEKFLERTLLYNRRMRAAIERLGLPCISIEAGSTVEALTERCVERLEI